MTTWYLWLNAFLFAVFAVFCALRVTSTSGALGYTALNRSGISEYLTVYGGLQIGLAIFFAFSAYYPELRHGGLLLAHVLYVPIVLFRWASVLAQWPVGRMTLGVGALETALLACAISLWVAGAD